MRIRAGAKSSQVAQFLNTGRFPTYLHRWYSTIYGIYGSGADPARFGGGGGGGGGGGKSKGWLATHPPFSLNIFVVCLDKSNTFVYIAS